MAGRPRDTWVESVMDESWHKDFENRAADRSEDNSLYTGTHEQQEVLLERAELKLPPFETV